jgi:5'-AMP-activated protein kinase catalytic alpha subunit
VVLFACICGQLPFEDQNTSDLYKKILDGDYTIPKFLSREASNFLSKILEKDPEKRAKI